MRHRAPAIVYKGLDVTGPTPDGYTDKTIALEVVDSEGSTKYPVNDPIGASLTYRLVRTNHDLNNATFHWLDEDGSRRPFESNGQIQSLQNPKSTVHRSGSRGWFARDASRRSRLRLTSPDV